MSFGERLRDSSNTEKLNDLSAIRANFQCGSSPAELASLPTGQSHLDISPDSYDIALDLTDISSLEEKSLPS
ncbi:hypothetical protein J6590_055350 [Homalodisca vitripennis]|nr:hypothetical protein J6590_055350 [Homalodisca vitripennis]